MNARLAKLIPQDLVYSRAGPKVAHACPKANAAKNA
jgi:hypothetical protein